MAPLILTVELIGLGAACASEPTRTREEMVLDAGDGRAIFNGRDLAGWVAEGTTEFKREGGTLPVWTVEDGSIVCAGSGFGFLRYDRKVRDFVLTLEFRAAPRTNSGIGIRHGKFSGKRSTRPSLAGYEIQILDDAGQEPSTSSTGSLYRYVAPKSSSVKSAGQWNTMRIECHGPKLSVALNDHVIHDLDQESIESIAKKPLSGYLSLQNHGGGIEFRRIRLQEFSAAN